MEAAMNRDTGIQPEFTEEDLKLFNLLARYSEHNAETELPLDYLIEEIQRDNIDSSNLEVLFKNMQDSGVISFA